MPSEPEELVVPPTRLGPGPALLFALDVPLPALTVLQRRRKLLERFLRDDKEHLRMGYKGLINATMKLRRKRIFDFSRKHFGWVEKNLTLEIDRF